MGKTGAYPLTMLLFPRSLAYFVTTLSLYPSVLLFLRSVIFITSPLFVYLFIRLLVRSYSIT